jgi:hypothetical protein
LDGVSDEWLENLQVDRVAGGRVPREWIQWAYGQPTFDPFCGLCITFLPR